MFPLENRLWLLKYAGRPTSKMKKKKIEQKNDQVCVQIGLTGILQAYDEFFFFSLQIDVRVINLPFRMKQKKKRIQIKKNCVNIWGCMSLQVIIINAYFACWQLGQQQRFSIPDDLGLFWLQIPKSHLLPLVHFPLFFSMCFLGFLSFFSLPESNAGLFLKLCSCSLRRVCPIHCHLLCCKSSSILLCPHWSSNSSFFFLCGQKTLFILRRFLVWKVESFLRSVSVILQHSEP